MFTGIIQQTGIVKNIRGYAGILNIEIAAPQIAKDMKTGDSVAVDGACLTVTELGNSSATARTTAKTTSTFTVQAIPETLDRTIIKTYKTGTIVNLESPLKMGDKLHGHLVQGHVDFTAPVKAAALPGDSKLLNISFPKTHAKYLALKGSVTVNGVSLTISALNKDTFTVALIPQTLNTTNLKTAAPGQEVNVEVDLMARYMEKILENKAQETADNFLRERGAL